MLVALRSGTTWSNIADELARALPEASTVASSDASEQMIYDVVKTVFEKLDELKGSHAAFRVLTPAEMLQGLSAPLHPGAERYYKERGWL